MFNYNKAICPNFIPDLLELKELEKECVYFILDLDNFVIKIGKSKDPVKRLKQLETANPFNLQLILILNPKTDKYTISELELSLHNVFSKYHKKGEWFYFKEDLEFFLLNLICNKQRRLLERNDNYHIFYNTINSYLQYRKMEYPMLSFNFERLYSYFTDYKKGNNLFLHDLYIKS